MSRKQQRRAAQRAATYATALSGSATTPSAGGGMQAFTFGDPTPVLDHSEVLDCFECWLNGKWYEPPVSLAGLAKSFHASVHHSSTIYFKTNILTSTFIPNKYLSRDAFKRFVLDFLTFGNGYLEKRASRSGLPLQLNHALAKYMRRGKDLDTYYFVAGWQQEYAFDKGSISHLMDPDLNQEVYGVPQYLSALQSAWLNEAATLFRRKYYKNGSHAGFVFYMTDAAANITDVDNLRQAMRDSKGPGNFRNLFMYAPNGKKDGIQILPVSDVAAKDEFFNIEGVTRDDVLAAHRVPPQLMGIMPNNTGGFGAIEPAAGICPQRAGTPADSVHDAQRLAGNRSGEIRQIRIIDRRGKQAMSDIADRADWRIEQDVQNARMHVGKQPILASDGRCHFCDEQVAHALLFCNVDCRDDYQKQQTALQRAGRRVD